MQLSFGTRELVVMRYQKIESKKEATKRIFKYLESLMMREEDGVKKGGYQAGPFIHQQDKYHLYCALL